MTAEACLAMLSNSTKSLNSLANDEPQNVVRDFFDSASKQYGSVPNIALMSSADDALEIQSSLSIPTQLVSADSIKPDAAKGDFTRLPKKPWSSIPNIHITFDETEATEIECIPMNVLVEIENGTKPAYDVHVYSDLITNTSH
uniref:Uncharacterized protein n=1 Tax=Schizaphis graminum TaxID=13262 RepID=A0A2S2PKH2_SCHGA